MNYEPVGNTPTDSANNANTELADIEQEFAEAAEMFNLDDSEGTGDLDELDAAIAGTDLAVPGAESAGGFNLLDFADGVGGAEGMPEWGFPNPFSGKAKRMVRSLIKKLRRYRKYRSCLPAVLKAVAAIKAKKCGTAIRAAYAAYRCMKSK